MSEPFSDKCAYCGSPDVLDDAWFCERPECWQAYYREDKENFEYQERTPLTRDKALIDLMKTKASVWGPPFIKILDSSLAIAKLAKLPVH